MATKMYVFWRLEADPPAPWTRLTRTLDYVRLGSDPANHWARVGAATHEHHTVSNWSCGTNNPISAVSDTPYATMAPHQHPAPASWTISPNNNNPLGYGLDIIYTDLATWEASDRTFPAGVVLVSNGVLLDAACIERFTDADGRFITHDAPGTLSGTSTPQNHRCQATTGNAGTAYGATYDAHGNGASDPFSHPHTVDANSDSQYNEPRNLVTRLYSVLVTTSKALAETVVFVDGAVGLNWEILTGWANANLKAGNSNPALSGSDTHTMSVSGTTSDVSGSNYYGGYEGTSYQHSRNTHNHPWSATLDAASHVPLSRVLIPARLKTTLLRTYPSSQCVMC